MSVRRLVAIFWRTWLPALLLFLLTDWAAEQAIPRAQGASGQSVRDIAHGLESPLFEEREAASKRLMDAQAPAVPALLAMAKEGSLEAAVRSVGILEGIYISADAKGDGAAVDAVEFALDELARSGRPPVADRAETVLETHYAIGERRALAEIQRLHGVPRFRRLDDSPMMIRNGRFNPAAPQNEAPGDPSKDHGELVMVIIGPKWSGGDEGLKQVARLKRLKMLYRIEGRQVTDEAVSRLRAAIPGLEVQVRGAAKLGISNGTTFGGPAEKGCLIQSVEKGEAAANAGLTSHDMIRKFDGRTVESFDTLIDILRRHKPGDTVETVILRDDALITVPVTLTGWD